MVLNLTPLLDLLLILLFAHQVNAWMLSAEAREKEESRTAELARMLAEKERKLFELERKAARAEELERKLAALKESEAARKMGALAGALAFRTVRLESDRSIFAAADGFEVRVPIAEGKAAEAVERLLEKLPPPSRDTVFFFSWGDVLVRNRDAVRDALAAALRRLAEKHPDLHFHLAEEGFDERTRQ